MSEAVPEMGKAVPLRRRDDVKPDRKPPGEPPAGPAGITTEHICGARRHPQDVTDICTSNSFRLVSMPDHALIFVCTQCHTVHRNLEGMKWVEL